MGVAIATLRLRSAADTPALRLRAARELQAAELTPASLPPAAVLVVRRLDDPLPGRFGGGRIRPRPEWEGAVRDALSAQARAAARPDDRGRLPPTAPAVLFTDEAELVACLLADRARGDLNARWWWRSILPRLGLRAETIGSPSLSRLLCARPRELPAALTWLCRWGEAPRIASALSRDDATAALGSLSSVHSLPAELVTRPCEERSAYWHLATPAGDGAANGTAARTPGRPVRAPWREWLPAGLADERCLPEVQCLFGVAVGLHAMPARMRSPVVVAQARRWWTAVAGLTPAISDAEVRANTDTFSRFAVPPQKVRTVAAPSALATPAGCNEVDSTLRIPDDRTGVEEAAAELLPANRLAASDQPLIAPDVSRKELASEPLPLAIASAAIDESGRSETAPIVNTSSVVREGSTHAASEPEPSVAADDSAPAAFPVDGVPTRIGGILYLIHALEQLGLPEAFEAGWHAAATAGSWGTLDLVGRALLAPRFASVARDPMWDALAHLSGWDARQGPMRRRSPSRRPAGRCDPMYRVPPDWIAHLADSSDRFAWTIEAGRLWLWSQAGYLVAHHACVSEIDTSATRRTLSKVLPASDARRAVERRPASRIPWLPLAELPSWCPARIGRWAAAVAPAVLRRLELALGIERHGAHSSAASIASLLCIPGRLYVTSSHVDLVVGIDRADLAVRRAGLDRDLGWLPAYGRVVYFHFE